MAARADRAMARWLPLPEAPPDTLDVVGGVCASTLDIVEPFSDLVPHVVLRGVHQRKTATTKALDTATQAVARGIRTVLVVGPRTPAIFEFLKRRFNEPWSEPRWLPLSMATAEIKADTPVQESGSLSD